MTTESNRIQGKSIHSYLEQVLQGAALLDEKVWHMEAFDSIPPHLQSEHQTNPTLGLHNCGT